MWIPHAEDEAYGLPAKGLPIQRAMQFMNLCPFLRTDLTILVEVNAEGKGLNLHTRYDIGTRGWGVQALERKASKVPHFNRFDLCNDLNFASEVFDSRL
jgi:hypothetical protein